MWQSGIRSRAWASVIVEVGDEGGGAPEGVIAYGVQCQFHDL